MKKLSFLPFALFCVVICAVVFIVPNSNTAAAKPNKETRVVINNTKLAAEEILLKNNQVFISLTGAKSLDNLTFNWNNTTKQVSVKGSNTNLLLTINKTTAQKNGVSVKLSTAPFIYRGKIMIPLRFVTEAMNSSVIWNQSTNTAFITKPSAKLISDFESNNLSTSRNAAINMPRISQLNGGYEPSLETFSLQYYFPTKTSDRFVEVNNQVISYYQIIKNSAQLKWQALIGDKVGTRDDLYFINRAITNEVGTAPQLKDTTLASFRWMPHVVSTGYSLINKENWNDVIFNQVDVPQNNVAQNYIIVDIPEE
ncbi:copper amine oxidase N-terminal domain-containing protein [Paenibacillus alvei]|uniref:Copper amine oxidase N-terminal domain-containing protein n=1 Tax=Paenibacillus alvei TaxID=44250 RepID=A0ABT4GRR5_PAEAL|nr:copper amine oxidase N-terminal domain-containing protein [Paenibacillus alvei]MCY9543618.1 copper amine oxidase N-terminal domain-containing protein [Paenibacillus alvei]MCY9736127.1 copper amine oxidase N-terminal domain-containing protein [Paenibacillus alvei]MCY9757328.1 copper amine oxidase N-terminal domain-containing protein [Paenibacillus alvei]MCY9759141.1 copper amine oxidase N-terminal domain-containing protein [Paenibacillus alvei]MCY9770400.1 copper amine oxidase N-terminal dom